MEIDSSRRQWLGMAVVCAITTVAGIVRTRVAQDSIKPDARHVAPENREDGHDRISGTTVGHPGGHGSR